MTTAATATAATIDPIRLERLPSIHLDSGSHSERGNGLCAMEAVAWLANEPHSDKPVCVDETLADYVRTLNDVLVDDHRDVLREYLPGMVNTSGTDPLGCRVQAKADAYAEMARTWLDFAGFDDTDDTDVLEAHQGAIDAEMRSASDLSDAEWYRMECTRDALIFAASLLEGTLDGLYPDLTRCGLVIPGKTHDTFEATAAKVRARAIALVPELIATTSDAA